MLTICQAIGITMIATPEEIRPCLPLRQRQRRRRHHQRDIHQRMASRPCARSCPARAPKLAPCRSSSAEIRRRLVRLAREKLDQADIGVNVVDVADESRVVAIMGELRVARDARQEIEQRGDEGREPDQHRRRQPEVEMHHGRRPRPGEEAAIPDGAHHAAQRVAQGARRPRSPCWRCARRNHGRNRPWNGRACSARAGSGSGC